MAERQYIGARYVPLFFENPNTGDSTWLQGVAYEALTIVTLAGNSYTSKKPVPASVGAPNLNPEYWVSTGIYSAQVEELRQEVEEAVEEVEGRMNELEESTDTRLDDLEAKPIAVFFGDSFLAGGQVVTEVCTLMGWTGKNYSVSGASFTSANPMTNQITNALADTTLDASKVKFVIIEGGLNDANTNVAWNTLISAVDTMCASAHTAFPNATIYVCGCNSFASGNQINATTYSVWDVELAMKYGVELHKYGTFISITNATIGSYTMTNPDTHPTDAVYQYLGYWIASAILGGNTKNTQNYTTTLTGTAGGGAYSVAVIVNMMMTREHILFDGRFILTFTENHTTVAPEITMDSPFSFGDAGYGLIFHQYQEMFDTVRKEIGLINIQKDKWVIKFPEISNADLTCNTQFNFCVGTK